MHFWQLSLFYLNNKIDSKSQLTLFFKKKLPRLLVAQSEEIIKLPHLCYKIGVLATQTNLCVWNNIFTITY